MIDVGYLVISFGDLIAKRLILGADGNQSLGRRVGEDGKTK